MIAPRNSKSQVRGLSLVEIMIVVGIIALVIVGIQGRGRIGKQTSLIQAESSNLSLIVERAKSAQMGRPDFSGINTSYLLSMGAFPESMIASGGTSVKNGWGGAVTVQPGAGNASVDIVYGEVPSAACVEWVTNEGPNYPEITIGTTKTKNGAALPDLDVVGNACKAAEKVSITFSRT